MIILRKIWLATVLAVTCLTVTSCKTDQKKITRTTADNSYETVNLIRIDAPSNGSVFTLGEKVDVSVKLINDTLQTDSMILFVNELEKGNVTDLHFTLETEKLPLGNQNIRVTAWKNGKRQSASATIKLKNNVAPQRYGYRILKTYPHDPDAYTQGLFYHEGYLYEGTGQWGSSSLRKVDLETGKIIQSYNLEEKYFGEGIALLQDKIFQLTWTSEIGFTYDMKTFSKTGTFHFNTQGWGLTSNEKELIMSDGSNTIYFMEPQQFNEVRRIEVYDDQGSIESLNELELIGDDLFANVYQTDKIVIINPHTGAVKAFIDFKGLLQPGEKTKNTDVLNGIAWDKEKNRIFVTGKKWPKLFQVELLKK